MSKMTLKTEGDRYIVVTRISPRRLRPFTAHTPIRPWCRSGYSDLKAGPCPFANSTLDPAGRCDMSGRTARDRAFT